MAYDDEIAYEETLAECLVSLFGDGAEDGVSGQGTGEPSDDGQQSSGEMSQTELIAAAAAAYENATEAQKKGDWAGYGKYMDELEKYLNKLAK